MDFNFTEEQTLLENMVTSFVRDNYPWEAREAIVKTEEGWKPENWTQFQTESNFLASSPLLFLQ